MTEVDLEEFQRSIAVRPMRMDDFDALITMQERCFPGMYTWERGHIQSQLKIFPAGQLVVEYGGKVVASSSSVVVAFAEYEDWHDWRVISDDGYIRNHDPDGDTLYGIEMMVDPDYRGLRLSRRLYEERKRIARTMNLERIIIGGRLPGYQEHQGTMSASDYTEAVVRKSLYDQVLTAQLANGFQLKRLIPNYLPWDKESCGYATFLEWPNVEFVPAKRRKFQRVRSVRICVVQYQLRPIDGWDEFAQQVEYFVDAAAENRADFVVFPELIGTQLLSYLKPERPGQAERALADLTPQYLKLFGDLAIKANLNIVGGSMFTVEGDHLYNAGYLFLRDGRVERQFKLHVTQSERKWWGLEGGGKVQVVGTDRGKVAILLSTDVEFPEVARIAAQRGAEILFVPFNTDDRQSYLRVRTCAQARAIENDCYVATAGCVGNLPQVDNVDVHYAQSGVYTPSDFSFPRDGVAAECPPNIEDLTYCDVDLETLRRHRIEGVSQNWSDPREDLYKLQVRERGAWEDL